MKLQSLVENSRLVIDKDILKEDGIFNPRRKTGDLAIFVHFKYRGLEKKVRLKILLFIVF